MSLLKSILLAGGALVSLTAAAAAADLPTKKAAPEMKASCFDSFNNWLHASADECPLTWKGITLYGTIDVGGDYNTHGVPFNRIFGPGVEPMIQKNSNRPQFALAPNGVSQSNIGVKVSEPLFGDLSFVARAEIGFDPYTLQLANSPGSLVQNNANLLQNQNGSGDGSRAGQIFNSQVYAGLSSKTFGTLTFGRVNTLTLDGVNSYDPMGGSYAFSVIGYSGLTAGVGDTENARANTAFKYVLNINNFRAAALAQVGGYAQGNAAMGEWQGQVGADFNGLSVDAIYSYVKDGVALANFSTGAALAAPALMGDLKATVSNDSSVMLLAKYTWGPVKLFGGYEYIRFSNPSNTFAGGFTGLDGITVPAGQVTSNAYINNKIQQVFWAGAKYAITPDLDVTGAYYHYNQNNYSLAGTNCGPNTTAPAPGFSPQGSANSKCAGTLDALSAMIDYRPVKRVDLYAGLMYSQVNGGLANGYLKSNNLDPTIGLRIKF